MTTTELIAIIRRDYLDDVSDAVAGPTTGALWSDAFLLYQVQEAQRQACMRQDLRHLFDATTAEICEIALVDGTQSYLVDPRVLRIANAIYDSKTLAHTTESKMLEDCGVNWRTQDAGEPEAFFIRGRYLWLNKAPSAAEDGETLYLEVWRYPLTTPAIDEDLEWTNDPERLAHWVAHRALLRPGRDSAKSVNAELAQYHRASFDNAFGEEVPASARAELFTYPEDIEFGMAMRTSRLSFYEDNFYTGG